MFYPVAQPATVPGMCPKRFKLMESSPAHQERLRLFSEGVTCPERRQATEQVRTFRWVRILVLGRKPVSLCGIFGCPDGGPEYGVPAEATETFQIASLKVPDLAPQECPKAAGLMEVARS